MTSARNSSRSARRRARLAAFRRKALGRFGQTGETIVEVLVAMTVAALAMVMLAMAISVAMGVTKSNDKAATDYYAASNDLAALSASDAAGIVQVKITDGLSAANTSGGTADIDVVYHVYDDAPGLTNGTPVAYRAKDSAEG